MRTISIIVFSIFVTAFVLVNCAQSSKRARKPVTAIKVMDHNNSIKIGEKVTVNLKGKTKDGSLRKTELFLDGKSVFVSDKIDFSFVIETNNLAVGTHYLKTLATTNDGIEGENFSDFLLLSDIIPKKFTYKIIKSYPHNIEHFTEGLEIRNGFLYESTGQEGSSAIYKTELASWKVIKDYKLSNQYFGEGITILDRKLYQLTYKSQIGFVRDPDTFELIKSWTYKNAQGWGLTNDGKSIIMSDGSEFLYYLDPDSFKETRKIQVCNQKGVVQNLNELEYINGEIWSNIWTTDNIVKIDPKTGKITAEIDLKGILSTNFSFQKTPVDVLNGIAYDNDKNKIYITGKLWPKLFEIKLVSLPK
jgi:glutaminyl-peptide cyclotransferase